MSLKTDYITVNQLIAMLETVKRETGGNTRVVIHDRNGDEIKPKRMDTWSVCRGNETLEPVAFTDEPI